MQMYRMHDAPDAQKAAIPVSGPEEARIWNTPEKGNGIFRTVNSFNGARRKDNLIRINAWCVDMDDGTKQEMSAKLHRSPLIPSVIVETKRGYQAYWLAQDGAKPEHWNALVLERLVPFFGADKNARDLCRILRAPGYLHLKDPSDPFKCSVVWRHHVGYSERQMAEAFLWVPDRNAAQQAAQSARREASRAARAERPFDSGEDFWESVFNLNCEEGLSRLSGHWAVSGEQYTFRRMSNGNTNVLVDGKGTSVFIDAAGKIGSLDGGGPSLANWLRWFKHDWKTVITVLKELYPRLDEIDRAAKERKRAA